MHIELGQKIIDKMRNKKQGGKSDQLWVSPSITEKSKLYKVANLLIGKLNVKCILEFGSRYGEDAIAFANLYKNAKIYSFECNPNTLDECRKNISKYKNILLTEKAVSNVDGTISFFSIDKDKTKTTWKDGNQGASSLLQSTDNYPVEQYVQKEVIVNSITLNTFLTKKNIDVVDIMWMDVQGAEILALEGLKDKISNIKIIHLEVEFLEIYTNQPLYCDIQNFFKDSDFILAGFENRSTYSGDTIFINKKFFSESKIKKAKEILTPNKEVICMDSKENKNEIAQKLKNYLANVSKENCYIEEPDSQILQEKNEISLEVMIPCLDKDADILPFVIDSVRNFSLHPITKISIVAPSKSKLIQNICKIKDCNFVNEETLLDITKENIFYSVNNIDRSGWLYQQFLKLVWYKYSKSDFYLVLDSDTIFIRPFSFYNNKMLLEFSNEFHQPYFDILKRLGFDSNIPVSFICHHQLINKNIMEKLINEIEEKNKQRWYDSILYKLDKTEPSGFSEYETYGRYLFSNYYENINLEFWDNLSFKLDDTFIIDNSFIDKLCKQYNNNYKTISFHSYNKGE